MMGTLTPTTSDSSFDAFLHEIAHTDELPVTPLFSPGTRLTPDLTLVAPLGAGGHGTVFEAHSRQLGRRVAVKLMPRAGSTDAALREAAALERLRHPRIVRLFSFGTTEGIAYIVMELLAGETLSARLRRSGPLSPEECGELIVQVADALREAHAHGILHRDIKPSNIFLVQGRGIDATLIDFGISRDLDATDRRVAGTPAYMSLEQLVSPDRIDGRADLWGLAATAYQALTGHRFERTPTPPSHHRSELWPAIDAWFERALDSRPTRRFSTPREMAQAWRDAARARPLGEEELQSLFDAVPSSLRRPLPPEAGAIDPRLVVLVAVALLVLLVLAGCARNPSDGGSVATVERADQPVARPDPPTEQATDQPIVITDRKQLDDAVSKLVTIVGEQTRTKIPTVLGVDVDGDYDLSERRVRVTGILHRHVVAPRKPDPDELHVATRGPGTYYSVVDPATNTLAKPTLDE